MVVYHNLGLISASNNLELEAFFFVYTKTGHMAPLLLSSRLVHAPSFAFPNTPFVP